MQSNLLTALSLKNLKRAVRLRVQIETLQNQLDRITGAQAAPIRNGVARRRKRKMSAAARAKISAAAKARWARFRRQKAKK